MNRLAIIVIGVTLLTTACGITGDSELQPIDSADLFGLDATSTTTSTTTTTTIVTVPPSLVVDPTIAATSTTIATEPVALYFVDGTRLVPVSIDLARAPSPARVIAALEAGPPAGEVGIGLRSLLPDDLVNTVFDSSEGFVTVDLSAEAFSRIAPSDQRTAIGQIVLTLVGPNGRPGIGQVRFTQDGQAMRVLRRDNVQSDPGELVSRQDYESLLSQITPTPTTEPPAETLATDASAPG